MTGKEIEKLLNLRNSYKLDLEKNHYKSTSITSYMYDINLFLEFIIDSNVSFFTELNKQIIYNFFEKMTYERKNSKRTLSRKYNTINNFLVYCIKEGYITNNPLKEIDKPEYDLKTLKEPKNEQLNQLMTNAILQETLTDRQKAFSKYYSLRDIAIISLLITTGIGVTELTQIDLDDISLKTNEIALQNGRKILINQTTKNHIQSYIEAERQAYDDSLRALFISSRGVRTRLSVRSVQRIIKKYSTNISINLSPQVLKKVYENKYTSSLATYMSELNKQLVEEYEKIITN